MILCVLHFCSVMAIDLGGFGERLLSVVVCSGITLGRGSVLALGLLEEAGACGFGASG